MSATLVPTTASRSDAPPSHHHEVHLSNDVIADALRSRIGADQVLSRLIERTARAGDASIYRLVPRVVVTPRHFDDVLSILDYCHATGLYLTFRAGGTSLSGQAVTDGILVDVANHWKGLRILEQGRRVAVQPGVVAAHVNAFLTPYRAKIGPDPASINACMMGGVAANNASGMCCGVEFNSYHTMHSMILALADGLVLDTAEAGANEQLERERPEIYRGLLNIRDRIRANSELVERIRRKFSIKNTCGYSMNAFVDFDRPLDILSHLLIGSEGTLGFIGEITLNTLPDKPLKATALVYFEDIVEAGRAIGPLEEAGADVLEIMDRNSMVSVAEEMEYPFVIGEPGSSREGRPVVTGNCAALLIEFQDTDEDRLQQNLTSARGILSGYRLLSPVEFTRDPAVQAHYWHMRKGLFPSVGAMREIGTAVLIEDIAVEPRFLADVIADCQQLFVKYEFPEAIIFGHAKDGNIHFVICTDFSQPAQTQRYAALMDELTRTVVEKYDGSLKAEHGTGRNIAPFVELEWGEELYELMWEVKHLLDPHNVLNPGVVLNRDPQVHLKDLKVMPAVSPVVDKCIECGFCEPRCPSRDLTTTPRQRIAILREVNRLLKLGDTESRQTARQILDEYEYYGNQTCATDGMCATSCPVKINTGEMIKDLRAEHRGGISRSVALAMARNFGLLARGMRFGLVAAGAGGDVTRNAVRLSSTLVHKLTGGRAPQLPFQIPIPKAAPPLRKPRGTALQSARGGTAIAPVADATSSKPASEVLSARYVPGSTPDDTSLNPQQSHTATTPDVTLSGDLQAADRSGVGRFAQSRQAAEVVYFPTCLTRSMGSLPGEKVKTGLADALMSVLEATGHVVKIPENIPSLCCGQPFFSKGFNEAGAEAARKTVASLWEISRGGEIPIVCDTSPCSGQFQQCEKYLGGQDLVRWKSLQILDFPTYFARNVLPAHPAESWPKLKRHVILHPTCTLMKLGGLGDLKKIAATFAESVTVPVMAECCGFAGDRGFNVPELTLSATRPESAEVTDRKNAAALAGMDTCCYSTCRTCEVGMTAGTGEIYSSIVHLIYDALVAPTLPRRIGVWAE